MLIIVGSERVDHVDAVTALAAGDEVMLLDDGAYFSLAKPEFDTLRELIEEACGLEDRPADQLRISRYQMSWWDELCSLGVVRAQAAEWEAQVASLRGLASGVSDDSGSSVAPVGSVAVPRSLEAELRPYQRDGLDWLAFLWDHGLGGILADDMGLGKTIQVLSLICRAREQDPTLAPFLVVAPTSVVGNWVAEASRFTPALSVVALPETLKKAGRTIDEVRDGVDVIVTSYALARLDAEGIAYSYLDGRTRKRDQAVDRSHRIGQTKTVFVYRMISTGTIEERVQALKQRKAELFAGVMDEGDLFNTALDAEDVRGLFS